MIVPDELYYSDTHEWVKKVDNIVIMGITDYAQSELTDVVYIELPVIGRVYKKKEIIATIESVKASSDIYVPLSGKVIEVNEHLNTNSELINSSPYENGWIAKIETDNPEEINTLLSPEQYRSLLQSKGVKN
ncbi:MAG: glycine cleavage system protein GcvH [Candidatus Thermoplasmatota archaeon]|jgi:glycine cleavage system H protein|nr:glycine cleavage system protein GcvH [Candidatus Thermoplasmatota archaeon]MCL5963916.1 glycine cleavage system protein GcvH [Candidatus Thermoplasmatota archaeon]